jgi:hypothetical protein
MTAHQQNHNLDYGGVLRDTYITEQNTPYINLLDSRRTVGTNWCNSPHQSIRSNEKESIFAG